MEEGWGVVTWEGAWLKHSREHRSFLFKCSRATICNRAWKTNLLIAALPFSDNRGDDSCSPDDTGARPEMRTTRLPSFLPSLPSSLSHLTVPEYRAQHPCHGDRVPMTILRKGGGSVGGVGEVLNLPPSASGSMASSCR